MVARPTGRPRDHRHDRIDVCHEHATSMIEQGFGYVCTCSAEAFREFRVAQTECPCGEIHG